MSDIQVLPDEAEEPSNPMPMCVCFMQTRSVRLPSALPERDRLYQNQSSSFVPSSPKVYAEALTLARAFRSSNRRCFLNRMTLNRSKSVSAFLRSVWSFLLAHLLSFHLASISAFSHAFFSVPVRTARGSLAILRSDSSTSEKEIACLGTTSLGSAEGPSTKA